MGRKRTLDPSSSLQVELLSCRACQHWWHSPAPSDAELMRLYQKSSPLVVTPGAKDQYVKKVHLDSFASFVERRAGDIRGKYLEVGPGGGQLMAHFTSLGYDCWGIEPGQWNPGERMLHSFSDIPTGTTYDLVVLKDVLEHTCDPVGMLTQLRPFAAPDAKLFCSFPCSDSRVARRDRLDWSMVLPLGHLHYFSRRSSAIMLERSGWSTVEAELTRATTIGVLLRKRMLRSVVWELVKGGPDQLNVAGIAS